MKRLRGVFITGLLVLVPVLTTIEVMAWFITTIDESARSYLPKGLLNFDFKGLGLVISIGIVVIVGILTQNYVGKWIVGRFDQLLKQFPVVGGLYGSIKKFLETILNPQNDQFKEVVLIEFPRKGVHSIGFLTGDPDPKLTQTSEEKRVNVFVPCTPNPTSGFYLIVPEKELIPLDMTVQEAFRTLISMGIVKGDAPTLQASS